MSELVQLWMDRAMANTGVLACGARLADRSFVVRTGAPDIAEKQLARALRELWEAVVALQQDRVSAERLRWSFENGQIRCVTRPGGLMGALLLTRESADLPEIDRLLAEFGV